jgi:L-aspartate oxidase
VGLALRLENQLYDQNKNGITSDLEYVQFHPTSLFVPNEARFLLTEALRGEGAVLRDATGRAFARDYHPNGELAPRDIVARAVFCESQKSTDEHNAFLDITHRDADWLRGRFPSIHQHLTSRKNPMDFTKECIPVIPAAHYTCGGVTTDLFGRVVGSQNSNGWYRNLFAAGEAARTGLHGGNRLASTSLLEGLVFGSSVGEVVACVGVNIGTEEEVMEAAHEARHAIELKIASEEQSPGANGVINRDNEASREATAILAQLKSLMWDNVGVVRDHEKLATAVSELTAIRDKADLLWEENSAIKNAGQEIAALRDAAYAGLAVAESALENDVSGGAHYVADVEIVDEMESEDDSGDEASDGEEEAMVAVARG